VAEGLYLSAMITPDLLKQVKPYLVEQ